jgi:hypothetical protein
MKGDESSLIDTLKLLNQELPKFLEDDSNIEIIPFKKTIVLQEICFQYNVNQKPVLNKLSNGEGTFTIVFVLEYFLK